MWETLYIVVAVVSEASPEDRRLTQNRAILAFSRPRKTQNIPKRVTNGEPVFKTAAGGPSGGLLPCIGFRRNRNHVKRLAKLRREFP